MEKIPQVRKRAAGRRKHQHARIGCGIFAPVAARISSCIRAFCEPTLRHNVVGGPSRDPCFTGPSSSRCISGTAGLKPPKDATRPNNAPERTPTRRVQQDIRAPDGVGGAGDAKRSLFSAARVRPPPAASVDATGSALAAFGKQQRIEARTDPGPVFFGCWRSHQSPELAHTCASRA